MKIHPNYLLFLLFGISMLGACSQNKQARTANDPTAGFERPVMPEAPKERNFTCLGNEPSWSLTIEKGQAITFTPMGAEAQVYPYVSPVGEEGRSSWIYSTQIDEKQTLVIVVRDIECSDGMSDRSYPFTVSLVLNKSTYLKGCGR